MKNFFVLIICFILPSFILRSLLRIIGFKIGKNVKIGFSIILTKNISLDDNALIGHFNWIQTESLVMGKNAYIKIFNFIRGPFNVTLKSKAAIGKNNIIRRSKNGISYGIAEFYLGELTKITAFHFIDVTRSIRFGDFSILAGIRSQIWTHGHMHAESGPTRFRVDGEVIIGDNVYIGSDSIINPGVTIANAINIGGNSLIALSRNSYNNFCFASY